MMTPPASCLIVALDNIGDLVFISSLLSRLQCHWPNTRFGIWCKDYASDIAALLPASPKIYAADPVWDRSPSRKRGDWRSFLISAQQIRRDHYDCAIISTRQWRAACATTTVLFGQKHRRIGYRSSKSRWWLTDPVAIANEAEPVTQELNRLLEPLIGDGPAHPYRLDMTSLSQRREYLQALRRQQQRTLPYIALHAFAGHPRRCLDLRRWLEFARALTKHGFSAMWIGTTHELNRIRQALPDCPPNFEFADHYCSGQLRDTAALIADAFAFVGHDSGPLHIAGGLGVAVLGLYLPGEPVRTAPQGVGVAMQITRSSPELVSIEELMTAFLALEERIRA